MCTSHFHVVSETPSKGRSGHSPAPPQPQGHKSHTSQLPWALSFTPPVLPIPLPSLVPPRPPWDPPNPTAGQVVSWGIASRGPCCSLSCLAHDLFNPKLSSHKYTSLMAGNLLFLCFSPASQRAISSSSCSLRQPPVVSPLFLGDIPGTQQNLLQHKDPKTPRKGSQTASQASGAAVPLDPPAYHQRFYYYYSFLASSSLIRTIPRWSRSPTPTQLPLGSMDTVWELTAQQEEDTRAGGEEGEEE